MKELAKDFILYSGKTLLNQYNENFMQVSVRDNNVDQALRVLKKKLQGEGVFREMKLKQHFEKPSEKKVRRQAEAIRRARKVARKKLERDGTL